LTNRWFAPESICGAGNQYRDVMAIVATGEEDTTCGIGDRGFLMFSAEALGDVFGQIGGVRSVP
jgi:hypothetical protein